MSDLARARKSPIPGFTIDDAKLVATTKWHPSWLGFYVFAAIWNIGLVQIMTHASKPVAPLFAVVGHVAGTAFALLALRALVARTVVRFDARGLTILAPLSPWRKPFHLDLAEIKQFEVESHPESGHTDVAARLQSGVTETLPIDWQPVPVTMRGSKKRLFVAKPETAAWLATQLDEMLQASRLLGHDTYRS